MLAEKFDIFRGVTAFAELDDGNRYILNLKNATASELEFADENLGLYFKANIEKVNDCKVLRYFSEFKPRNLGETLGRNHYNYECSVGLHIKDIEDISQFVATYNKSEFWVHPFFGKFCELPASGEKLLKDAINRFKLSPRAYTRILKVARTIADLAGAAHIGDEHIFESINYRQGDLE